VCNVLVLVLLFIIGCGKSSLLMSLLQELVTLKGRSLMNGSVAYASQKAWIQNATGKLCCTLQLFDMSVIAALPCMTAYILLVHSN
jgi:ABC-type transport system involved in cytochrome bd biosynthesis fused ATPase/permease subunit